MAMSSGDGSATEEDRGESEDGGSYEHEEASESSEDLDDYEPQTGIQVRRARSRLWLAKLTVRCSQQVLQINFDPRIFGFILEFFQVMLMSIYSGRASSPSPPVEDVAPILTESSSFGTEIDR